MDGAYMACVCAMCRQLSAAGLNALEASFTSQHLYHHARGTVSDSRGTSGWVKSGKGMKDLALRLNDLAGQWCWKCHLA